MQIVRNVVWWGLAVAYSVALVVLVGLGQVFSNVLQPLPQPVLISSAFMFFVGYVVRGRFKDASATLIHEIGHAMAAGLVFQRVKYIRVEMDTSGVMVSQVGVFNRLTYGIVSAAGPLANIIFLLFTVRAMTLGLSAFWLAFVAGATILILVSTVRNVWGWITGVIFSGNLVWLLYALHNFEIQAVPFSDSSAVQSVSVAAIMLIVSHNAGSTIRYNIMCRKAPQPTMDEYKFGKWILLGPWAGGHLILLANIVGVAYAVAFMFGLTSPMELIGG
jgi:Peptidase M50B-like